MHGVADAGGQVLGDHPVGPGLAHRRDGLAHQEDPALGVAEGAVFLGKGRAGEDDGGVFGRLGQEDVLDDEDIQVLQGRFHVAQVRVGDQGVFARRHRGP